jgi:hypothetical protein
LFENLLLSANSSTYLFSYVPYLRRFDLKILKKSI